MNPTIVYLNCEADNAYSIHFTDSNRYISGKDKIKYICPFGTKGIEAKKAIIKHMCELASVTGMYKKVDSLSRFEGNAKYIIDVFCNFVEVNGCISLDQNIKKPKYTDYIQSNHLADHNARPVVKFEQTINSEICDMEY